MSIEYYNENALEFYNNTVSVDMTQICQDFVKLVKPEGKILDAGCGSGRDTLFFIKNGHTVVSIDASDEMVRLSSELTGQKTIKMQFQEMEFVEEFDGVWACASLLHVSRCEIDEVIEKIASSLKKDGIFYASFKYGEEEIMKNGRLFNFYNEETLKSLFERPKSFTTIGVWKTQDNRPDRQDEFWINILCKKL